MPDSPQPDFQGKSILFLKNVFLYVLVMAPLVAFCLMGEKWAHILFGMAALSLPIFLLAGALIARFDRFSLDDEHARIIKSGKRTIPYQSIQRIDINETGRLMQVSIKQGLFRKTSLAYALDNADKPRFLEELLKRLPQVSVRERRFVDWKSIGIIAAMIILLTVGFHLYLHQQYSELAAVPQQVAWSGSGKKARNAQQYMLGEFSIAMSKQYQVTGQDEGGLQLEDRETKTAVTFIIKQQKDVSSLSAAFLGYATGIHDYADVLETGYHARVGVIPLMIKLFALSNLADVRIYEIRQPLLVQAGAVQGKAELLPAFTGFATQGKKKDQELITIVLKDRKRKADMQIFISASKRLDEKALQGIMAGISLRPSSPNR